MYKRQPTFHAVAGLTVTCRETGVSLVSTTGYIIFYNSTGATGLYYSTQGGYVGGHTYSGGGWQGSGTIWVAES